MKEKLLDKILDYFDNRVKTSCENKISDYQITLKLSERSYFDMEDIFNSFPNYRKNYIKKIIKIMETKTIEDIKNIGKTYYRKDNYESNYYKIKRE
jgi:phage pi2 protein 07